MKKRGRRRGRKSKVEMLPVPYEQTKELPIALNEAQRAIVFGKTPIGEIFWRKVRGGTKVPYVQGHYVTGVLNEAFGHNWDEEYTYDTDAKTAIEIGQVLVHCRLTVRVGDKVVRKSASGGAEIDRYSTGPKKGKIISLSDDFKSAETDALKKCASKLGIARDVYRWVGDDGKVQKPEGDESQGTKDVNPRPADPAENDTDKKRVTNKLTILNQTWLRLQKLLPQIYTETKWAELWREYKTAAGKKNFPTQESQIDDLTSLLSIDLQEHMKGGKK